MKQVLLFFFLFLGSIQSYSQSTQIVKGQVLDIDSDMPLIGATVQLMDESLDLGSITDFDGYFKLDNVPVGRQNFVISYLGYEFFSKYFSKRR